MISVIVPAYNAEAFIYETLTSVFLQTYRPLEVLIVNDGSSDDTEQKVRKFCDDNKLSVAEESTTQPDRDLIRWEAEGSSSDFRLIHVFQPNGGPSRARNTGIAACKGDYIAFLDADDVWQSTKLSEQLDFLTKNELDVVFTDLSITKDNKIKHHSVFKEHGWNIPQLSNEPLFWFKRLLKSNFIVTSTLLVRKNCFSHIDLFDEKIRHGEDYDIFLRLALFYKFGFLDSTTIIRSIHDSNLTQDEQKFYYNKIYILNKLNKDYRLLFGQNGVDLNGYIARTHREFAYYYYVKSRYLKAMYKYSTYIISKYLMLRF